MSPSQINDREENVQTKQSSNFSIEHILYQAGKSTQSNSQNNINNVVQNVPLAWLQCTRYCPPKIPRVQKKETPQKRQLGRHPRIPFTSYQLSVLEERFKHSPYLSSQEVTQLSSSLELADIRVKIWFQNRRARERRERLLSSGKNSEDQNNSSLTQNNNISYTTQSCFLGI